MVKLSNLHQCTFKYFYACYQDQLAILPKHFLRTIQCGFTIQIYNDLNQDNHTFSKQKNFQVNEMHLNQKEFFRIKECPHSIFESESKNFFQKKTSYCLNAITPTSYFKMPLFLHISRSIQEVIKNSESQKKSSIWKIVYILKTLIK